MAKDVFFLLSISCSSQELGVPPDASVRRVPRLLTGRVPAMSLKSARMQRGDTAKAAEVCHVQLFLNVISEDELRLPVYGIVPTYFTNHGGHLNGWLTAIERKSAGAGRGIYSRRSQERRENITNMGKAQY